MDPATFKTSFPGQEKNSPRSTPNRERGARDQAHPGSSSTLFGKDAPSNVSRIREREKGDFFQRSIETAGKGKGKAKAEGKGLVQTPRKEEGRAKAIGSRKASTQEQDILPYPKKKDEKRQPGAAGPSSSKQPLGPKRRSGDLSVVIFSSSRPRDLKEWGLFLRSSRDKGTITLIKWSVTRYKHDEKFFVDPTELPRFEQEIFVGHVDNPTWYEELVMNTKLQKSTNWTCQDWVLDVLERLSIHNDIGEDKYSQAVLLLRKEQSAERATRPS